MNHHSGCCGSGAIAHEHSSGQGAALKDPVCGMRLEEADVQATATHRGRAYHFCSVACRRKFEQSPDRYAGPRDEQKAAAPD